MALDASPWTQSQKTFKIGTETKRGAEELNQNNGLYETLDFEVTTFSESK